MSIYLLPYAAFFFLASCSRLVRRRDMLTLVLIVTLLCAFMAGIRSKTDNDWATYLEIFSGIPPATEGLKAFLKAIEDLYLEPAFALLVALIKVALPDVLVFMVMSVTSMLLYFSSFKKVARYPAIAFLVYIGDGYYLREFTQIRFGLAVALGFAGICALYLGRARRYWVLSIAGMAIHYTGIVLFAAQLWTRFLHTRRRIMIVSTVMFALAIAGAFSNWVEQLAYLGFAPARLMSYVDTDDSAQVSQFILIGQFVILMACAYWFDDRQPEYFFVSIYALSFTLLCLFSGFDLMRRMSFFFTTALYVLASVALEKRRYALLALLVAYSITLFAARQSILYEYATILG